MSKIFLFFLLFFAVQSGFAQISVKGKIVDKADNKALTNASIVLLNTDSILRYFTRADESGKFELKNIANGTYYLLASYPKFELHSDTIKVNGKNIDLADIKINSQQNVLEEAVVTRRLPITIKGDTVEYDAASFETEKNAKLEDLLRRLPGFTVSGDGNITAQGKAVQKVFIDGEEFFGYDPKIAIRNVRADAVDKVQLYEKKSEEAELSGVDDGVRIQTVNVVLKEEARKGIFGNAEAIYGTKNLYAASLFTAYFNRIERIGVTASHSNMGSSSGREGSLRMNSQIVGRPQNTSAGLNYENQFLKKAIRMNASYSFNDNSMKNETDSYNKRILPNNNIQERTSRNETSRFGQNNGVESTFKIRLDSTQNLDVRLNGSIGNNENNNSSSNVTKDGNQRMVSDFTETNSSKSTSNNSLLRLNYRKRFGKGNSINVQVGNNNNNNESNSRINSTTNFYALDSVAVINQKRKSTSKGNNFSSSVNYNRTFSDKFNLGMGYSLQNNYDKDTENSFDAVSNQFDSLYSKNQLNKSFNQGFNLNGNFRTEKISVSLTTRTNYKTQALKDTYRSIDLSRDFWDNNSNVQVNYSISNSKNINLSYNYGNTLPSFGQLQPLQPQTNPLFRQEGNPNLKRSYNHAFSTNYNSYSILKASGININADLSLNYNPIVSKTTIDENTVQVSSFENLFDKINWNTRINASHSKQVFASRVRFTKNMAYTFNNSYSYIRFENSDNNQSYVLNNARNSNYRVGSNLNEQNSEGFDYDFSANVALNNQKNTMNVQYNYTNLEGNASAYLTYNFPLKIVASSNVYYSYAGPTKLYNKSIHQFYMNMEVGKKILKDESLRISLKAFDIFKTYNNTRRNVSDTNYSESNQLVLTQYFMLGVKWDFNKKLGKKND